MSSTFTYLPKGEHMLEFVKTYMHSIAVNTGTPKQEMMYVASATCLHKAELPLENYIKSALISQLRSWKEDSKARWAEALAVGTSDEKRYIALTEQAEQIGRCVTQMAMFLRLPAGWEDK